MQKLHFRPKTAVLFGAFAMALIILLAVVGLRHNPFQGAETVNLGSLLAALGGGGVMFGAVTFNYLWPATGAVAPTAAQVANQDSVNVNVTTDGAAVTFTVTHNLGISVADLALGYPDVIIEPESTHSYDTLLLFMNPATPAKTTNAIIFTCAAVAAQILIKVKRPFSMGR